MILDVDQGNSRLKWRLRNGDGVVARGMGVGHDYDAIFFSVKGSLDHIYVSSVVPSASQGLDRWCRQRWGVVPVYARVDRYCAGVTNGYADVEQMGIDRWLAMVAAYQHVKSSCVVIDVGSACTVDLLQEEGLHLGGYIVPGIELMNNALFRDTDRVRLMSLDYTGGLAPGRTTAAAVGGGLQAMLTGLVAQGMQYLLDVTVQSPVLLFTGGGGKALADMISVSLKENDKLLNVAGIDYIPELVLDGLSWVCAQSSENTISVEKK